MAFKGKTEPEDPFEDPHPEKRKGEVGQDMVKSSKQVELGGQLVEAKELRQLSFSDLLHQFGNQAVVASEVIETDQFGMLLDKDNKALLVKQPMIIVKWDFYPGDFGKEFVSAWVITQDDKRYILNDGSTGICDQLRELTDRTGRKTMLGCPKGLRVSEYDYTLPTGAVTRAKTFYIDLSL